eukprot:scaffold99478_cov55-Phaeocystis_antarctica.AAC.1
MPRRPAHRLRGHAGHGRRVHVCLRLVGSASHGLRVPRLRDRTAAAGWRRWAARDGRRARQRRRGRPLLVLWHAVERLDSWSAQADGRAVPTPGTLSETHTP